MTYSVALVATLVCGALMLAVSAQYIPFHVSGTTARIESSADEISSHSTPQDLDSDDLADEEDWEKYTTKGDVLMRALPGTDENAGHVLGDTRCPPSAASVWKGDLKQELQTWHWHYVSPAISNSDLNEDWHISTALHALGLDGRSVEEGGDNQCWRIEHWNPNQMEDGHQVHAINQLYQVGGKTYRATQAHFDFSINIKGGAVFAFSLESPETAARKLWYKSRRSPDPNHLPRLRAFSDILWGFWSRNNHNVKGVRYFIVLGIVNDETNLLIKSCLHNAKRPLCVWPGTSFSTDTDEGQALLGSPIGAAFAYFLIQHKAELGLKTISKVTVFRPETDDDVAYVDPALVLQVENVRELALNEGRVWRKVLGCSYI